MNGREQCVSCSGVGGSDSSFSKAAGWHFENVHQVLRLVFNCDGMAVVLWSHPHCENEEGVDDSCGFPPSTVQWLWRQDHPFEDGSLSVLHDRGTRRPCQLHLELSEQKLKPEFYLMLT